MYQSRKAVWVSLVVTFIQKFNMDVRVLLIGMYIMPISSKWKKKKLAIEYAYLAAEGIWVRY